MMLVRHGAHTAGTDAYEAFVATLGERDRRNVRRHVEACEGEPTAAHAALWKRLACTLASLCDRAARTTGVRAVQFFSADGSYQMQLFALEDRRDGSVAVYTPDALAAAEGAGVISRPTPVADDVVFYQVAAAPGLNLRVEVLSAARTCDAPDYYRHLLGWNRRALRIMLGTAAGEAQVAACEAICRLAARQAAAALPPRLDRSEAAPHGARAGYGVARRS
jgi:hypothetical protein